MDEWVRQRQLVTAGEERLPVGVEEIAYFYTLHEIVYLVRHDGRKFALEQLEKLLDPALFFRLNRQYLSSLKAIGKIYSYFAGKLKIELLPARMRGSAGQPRPGALAEALAGINSRLSGCLLLAGLMQEELVGLALKCALLRRPHLVFEQR